MKSCKNIKNHINRLEGQLRALSHTLESESSCEALVHLTLSASKSFDSLKAKIFEAYLNENILKRKSPRLSAEVATLTRLIKS